MKLLKLKGREGTRREIIEEFRRRMDIRRTQNMPVDNERRLQVAELMITNKNERRKGQDRRQVEIPVDEERRKAERRDSEIHRLHELYHEGDIP